MLNAQHALLLQGDDLTVGDGCFVSVSAMTTTGELFCTRIYSVLIISGHGLCREGNSPFAFVSELCLYWHLGLKCCNCSKSIKLLVCGRLRTPGTNKDALCSLWKAELSCPSVHFRSVSLRNTRTKCSSLQV